jgi:hypothetical protein
LRVELTLEKPLTAKIAKEAAKARKENQSFLRDLCDLLSAFCG